MHDGHCHGPNPSPTIWALLFIDVGGDVARVGDVAVVGDVELFTAGALLTVLTSSFRVRFCSASYITADDDTAETGDETVLTRRAPHIPQV